MISPFHKYCLYNSYINLLKEVCKDHKLTSIGSVNGYKLYCIRINNKSDKNIAISAGIHGDEVAGPWALLKFLGKLPKKYNYTIFPIANPTGFDVCKRRNYLNLDLNRHFRDKKLTGENKMLYNALPKKLHLFLSLHEHPQAKGFYIYCSDSIKKEISQGIIKLSKKYFKTRTNHYGKRIPNGEIRYDRLDGDGSFEDKMFEDGVPYIVTETPGSEGLNKRIQLQYEILEFVLKNYDQENSLKI